MKNMKIIIIGMLLTLIPSIVFATCVEMGTPLGDAEIQQKIVGTWKIYMNSSNGYAIHGTVNFQADGTFHSIKVISRTESERMFRIEGVWEVREGLVIQTVKTSNNTKAHPVGKSCDTPFCS